MTRQRDYKRQAPRVKVSPPITVTCGSETLSGRLHDLSVNSARMTLDRDLDIGTLVDIEIPTVGVLRGSVLRVSGNLSVVTFTDSTPREREAIADYLQVFKVMYSSSR